MTGLFLGGSLVSVDNRTDVPVVVDEVSVGKAGASTSGQSEAPRVGWMLRLRRRGSPVRAP